MLSIFSTAYSVFFKMVSQGILLVWNWIFIGLTHTSSHFLLSTVKLWENITSALWTTSQAHPFRCRQGWILGPVLMKHKLYHWATSPVLPPNSTEIFPHSRGETVPTILQYCQDYWVCSHPVGRIHHITLNTPEKVLLCSVFQVWNYSVATGG